MSIILAVLSLLFPTPDRVEALRVSAPSYLTTETAREHLTAAQAAAVQHDLEPELLLAIAYRESRYTVNVTGPEVRGKHACGVMQPLMETACRSQTLLEGYLVGARHLRGWLDTKTCRGDLRCAMLGYAGGYSLLKGCAAGKVLVERSGRKVDLCTIPAITFARAKRIHVRRPVV
jgi:hypothetical protein